MRPRMKPEIRYEDNAVPATMDGYACKTCNRFWGQDQHMARWCCATSLPCPCGKRTEKHYAVCDACRDRERDKRWNAKPAVNWDGEFPIGLWDSDRYFFNEEELIEYAFDLDELEDDPAECVDRTDVESVIEHLKLTSCTANQVRHFEVNDYCCDELAEDGEVVDAEQIDSQVNAILSTIGILSWSMTGDRLSIDSLLRHLPSNHRGQTGEGAA